MENNSRRSFLKKSAIALAGAGLYSSMPVSCALNAPSDRANIGVIGLGLRVTNMRDMLEGNSWVHCTALCDVDQIILEEKANFLKERFPESAGNMKLYTDFHKLLEDCNR